MSTIIPDWEKVEKMVGLPDYGVAFCVSPWPDGGWIAGLFVTDREWVQEQIDQDDGAISSALANAPGETDSWPVWDVFDGFKDEHDQRIGLRAHGSNAAEAIDELWQALHRLPVLPQNQTGEP